MSNYVRDEDGKFIPASQRPDGTWRKARRVKDGYVPQEEVPLYESKGKQTKKPDLPVGMCPLIAKAAQEKRVKQQLKQNKAAVTLATNASSADTSKKPTNKSSPATARTSTVPAVTAAAATASVIQSMATMDLKSDEEVQKQLKKLRKKIREIEAIEEKLKNGELKTPEQDQLDKVARKAEILRQIAKLETL